MGTVNLRFNEFRFNVKSQLKVQRLVTKMEFHFKKSQFSVKSRFKESKCVDRGHSLYWDFAVHRITPLLQINMESYSTRMSFLAPPCTYTHTHSGMCCTWKVSEIWFSFCPQACHILPQKSHKKLFPFWK